MVFGESDRNQRVVTCLVCGWPEMESDDGLHPRGYEICSCCGTQFGKDDFDMHYDYGVEDGAEAYLLLRKAWIDQGAPWWSQSRVAPADWDAAEQLRSAFGHTPHKLRSPESS